MQKNPRTIRAAEEKKATEMLSMNVAVNLTRAWQLSGHLYNMCSVAREAVYTREADVRHWLDRGKHPLITPCLNQHTLIQHQHTAIYVLSIEPALSFPFHRVSITVITTYSKRCVCGRLGLQLFCM